MDLDSSFFQNKSEKMKTLLQLQAQGIQARPYLGTRVLFLVQCTCTCINSYCSKFPLSMTEKFGPHRPRPSEIKRTRAGI